MRLLGQTVRNFDEMLSKIKIIIKNSLTFIKDFTINSILGYRFNVMENMISRLSH